MPRHDEIVAADLDIASANDTPHAIVGLGPGSEIETRELAIPLRVHD